MATKNPYSPVTVPDDWKGKARTFAINVSRYITELFIRVTNIARETVTKDKVVNNLTTDLSGYVLDARQGKALKDSIGEKAIASLGTVPADTTETISSTENVYGILATYTSASSIMGLWYVRVGGESGSAIVKEILAASNIEVTGISGDIKVKNNTSGTNAQVKFIPVNGDPGTLTMS